MAYLYSYRGEDPECAAVANVNTMLGISVQPHTNPAEDSMGIYSTSGSEADSNRGGGDSVSTSLLVGTFYNPNNPSDTNSMVSSLQDELSNSAPHEENYKSNSKNHDCLILDLSGKDAPEEALVLTSSPRRRVWFWSFFLALCLLIGIAVSMGIVIGVNHEKSKTAKVRGSVNSVRPTIDSKSDEVEANWNATQNISAAPASTQTAMPTSLFQPRPSSATQTINAFVRSLPSYTQQALEAPTSPQQRALNWLTKDPSLTSYAQSQLLQRFVLKTFFFATNGDHDELLDNSTSEQQWIRSKGWSSSSLNEHECQWFTTYQDGTIEPPCDDQGIYAVLSVRRNNLRGRLPLELTLLTALSVLDLGLNSIESEIPTEFGLLTNLRRLQLGGNDLTGTVPTQMGQLSLLVELELDSNALSSTIPSQLGQLHQLVNLTLADNQLQGEMPSQLGELTLLENMLLHGNLVSGSIPAQIGRWTHLQSLSLRNNQLSGDLPSQVGLLTNLERIWAYQNELSGSFPSHLAQATRLTHLSLSRNQLTGQLPTEIGQLKRLKNLWLYQNHFTGSLPTELGLLTELELLPVRDNEIRGTVPAEVCALERLEVTIDCLEVACDCDCTCADEVESNYSDDDA